MYLTRLTSGLINYAQFNFNNFKHMAGESPFSTRLDLARQKLYQVESVLQTETLNVSVLNYTPWVTCICSSKVDVSVLSSARGPYICLAQQESIYLFKEGSLQLLNSYQIGKRTLIQYSQNDAMGYWRRPHISGHRIDCIGWSDDGYCLALGDCVGSLHIVIPSLNVLHSQVSCGLHILVL